MITAYNAYGQAIATYNDDGTLIQTFNNSDGTSRTTADAPTVPAGSTSKFFSGVTFDSIFKNAGDILKILFPTGISKNTAIPDSTPTYPYLPTNPTTGKNFTGIGWIVLVIIILAFLFSGYNPFKKRKK